MRICLNFIEKKEFQENGKTTKLTQYPSKSIKISITRKTSTFYHKKQKNHFQKEPNNKINKKTR